MDSPLINADERRYAHSELTEKIIGVFYDAQLASKSVSCLTSANVLPSGAWCFK
jgi:hypothetical protein